MKTRTAFQNVWLHRDLLRFAAIWQVMVTVLAVFIDDREFWMLALRFWFCFWVGLILYLAYRSKLTMAEMVICGIGPVIIFGALAARCLLWP